MKKSISHAWQTKPMDFFMLYIKAIAGHKLSHILPFNNLKCHKRGILKYNFEQQKSMIYSLKDK